MNSLSKQYIKEVKAFFPVKRRRERKYLRQSKTTINEYCQRRFDAVSMEKLYAEFGPPSAIANEYFSTLDMQLILKRMYLVRKIKICLLATSVIGLALFSLFLYDTYKLMESQMIYSIDEIIEEVED